MALSRTLPVAGGLALGAALAFASPAAAAPSSQDATWLKAAHQYNLTEISAGQAAQSHAASATVRNLGQMFVTDHTAGDAQLRTVAAQLGVTLPATPDATQQQQLAQASAATGTAFDALFLSSQTSGHRKPSLPGQLRSAPDRTRRCWHSRGQQLRSCSTTSASCWRHKAVAPPRSTPAAGAKPPAALCQKGLL